MKFTVVLAIFVVFVADSLFAAETCSRVVTINYQEVLLDINSNQKGEGLRFYLEKDEVAKSYLDRYQEGSKADWSDAALGTLGSVMIIGGALSSSDKKQKDSLLIGGAALMALNFLIARTRERYNESHLINAIEEYNKRNLPKIQFNPSFEGDKKASDFSDKVSFFLTKEWNF